MGRLKELQYLNLALNNIETIENLEGMHVVFFFARISVFHQSRHLSKGCEFLEKLDFTVNFIGDLLSVESLRSNLHLREIYLTGNPCTEYNGYREFVVGTLPQLAILDGKQITKSERIAACQHLKSLRTTIQAQQEQHAIKRKREKEAFQEKALRERGKKRNPGFDGRWYTDPQAHMTGEQEEGVEDAEAYTPEYRLKNYPEDLERQQQESKQPE